MKPDHVKALALEGIVHRFGHSYALRGTGLELARGEVLALYGANGAGKTTLLKIIATALTPTRGGGQVLGYPLTQARSIRARCLLVSHALGLYADLDARENLEFSLRLHERTIRSQNSRPQAIDSILSSALERVGLGSVRTRVRGFSSGMRKRLAIAKMLALEPELILLDEPFAALDPAGKDLIEALLREAKARGATLVIASHEPERTSRIATLETTLESGLLSTPKSPTQEPTTDSNTAAQA